MKTNKDDIRLLKKNHRLECVMQETGLSFEADAANSDQWHGKTDDGFTVTVNIKNQMYELSRPGMDTKVNQDVIDWLKRRFSWSFPMAKTYLKKRAPDPKQKTQPVKVKKPKQPQFQQSDYVTISNIYTNPETGAQSYGSNYNYSIMDDLQKRALDLWSGAVKYFDKSSDEVWDKIQNYPKRFKPVVDFDIEKCANCEKRFNWKTAGTIVYAQEEQEFIYVAASDDKDLEVTGNIIASGGCAIETLFIDADFVICEECLRGIYAPRYAALKLVHRSARKRKEAREEERRQIERERAREEDLEREREEERMNYESYERDSAAREEIR